MFDVNEIKSALTLDNYRTIIEELGGEIKNETSEYWIMNTGDHHLDWNEGTPKLYFYLESKKFFSFTTSSSFDIIGFIQKRWELEDRDFTFPMIIEWLMSVVGLSESSLLSTQQVNQPSWKTRLKPYLRNESPQHIPKVYSKECLDLCLPYYHPLFINDGISIDTMKKFRIGWYPSKAQITIPVFDRDGSLLGVHCRNTNPQIIEKGYKYIPLKTLNGDYRFKSLEVFYGMNTNADWIEESKQAILFESPKAVLQLDTMYGYSNSLGMFGLNLGKQRRDILLSLGVNEIIIAIDKDYESYQDEKFKQYTKNVEKIAKLFKGFCKTTLLFDDEGLLGLKDSPTDKGKDVFEKLMNKRCEISC